MLASTEIKKSELDRCPGNHLHVGVLLVIYRGHQNEAFL